VGEEWRGEGTNDNGGYGGEGEGEGGGITAAFGEGGGGGGGTTIRVGKEEKIGGRRGEGTGDMGVGGEGELVR